jgi:hypothetical protein
MAIGRNGERSSQLATCAQIDVIQTQWRDAADAARLTELERRQLFHREILNEFTFRA